MLNITWETILWIVIEVIIIVLIVTIFIVLRLCLPDDYIDIDDEYFDPFSYKTGDILCVGYKHVGAMLVHLLSGTEWSHTGIIWRDPNTNEAFVLEGARYKGKKYHGFFKIDLMTWYKINKYSKVCRVPIEGTVDPDVLYEAFTPFLRTENVKGININWVRFLSHSPYKDFNEWDYKHRTCVEATIHTLQTAGIFEKEYAASSFYASHVIRRGIKCRPGFKYLKPRRVHRPKYPTILI